MGDRIMTKPMIKIHNVETGEIVEREMNAQELKQHEIDRLAHEAAQSADEDKTK